jgi:hypothetical protein
MLFATHQARTVGSELAASVWRHPAALADHCANV